MRPLSWILATLLLTTTLIADDLDEALEGFDDPTPQSSFDESTLDGFDDEDAEIRIIDEERASKWYDLTGSLSFLGAYNYAQSAANAAAPGDKVMDFSGLSRARTKLDLALDMRHSENWKSRVEVMGWYDASWTIKGRDDYTDDVLDSYESFYDLKDAYVHGTLTPSLDIKIGRQIVIWGKSDSIRITDVINPLDIREPGMVDIEDLRLSETMTKLDYYFGDYGVSAIVIHEPRLQIEPAFGSDYRPRDVFGRTIADSQFPARDEPGWGLDNTQFALSIDGRYEGWDLSWYAANVFNSRFGIEVQSDGTPLRTYEKINMLGSALNIVSGFWLYKAEAAYIAGIDYRSVDEEKDRLDALLGVDYSGFTKTVLSLELADRHLFDYEEAMLLPATQTGKFPDYEREDTLQIAARGSYTFDHDNATVNYLLSMFGSNDFGFEDGGFQRLWIDYKYDDSISLNGGIVDYIGGDGTVPFYNAIKDNDRIYAELVYNF